MPADIIIYALVAVGLVFWLKSILGTRHGDERSRLNPFSEDFKPRKEAELQEPGKPFSEHHDVPGFSAQDKITQLAQNPQDIISINNKTAENGLLDIAKLDRGFDVEVFLNRAQDAFAFVVEAFAEGDKDTLQGLLTPDVYKVFEKTIDANNSEEEQILMEILAFRKAEVQEAKLEGKRASIAVKFVAEESTYVRDNEGDKISSTSESVTEISDIWVFSRDLRSNDPRWLVSETRGDFDGDNDRIPDTH